MTYTERLSELCYIIPPAWYSAMLSSLLGSPHEKRLQIVPGEIILDVDPVDGGSFILAHFE